MSSPVRALIVALAIAAGALTISKSLSKPGDPAADDPMVGTIAPDFSLLQLSVADPEAPFVRRSLADYDGKVLVVDFWATFCAPCRRSIPHVERLGKNYADQGVRVISINADFPDANRVDAVRAFARDQRMDADILMDDGRTTYAYQALRIPMLFIIDRDRVVQRVFRGYTEYVRLAEALDSVLASSQGGVSSVSRAGAP